MLDIEITKFADHTVIFEVHGKRVTLDSTGWKDVLQFFHAANDLGIIGDSTKVERSFAVLDESTKNEDDD